MLEKAVVLGVDEGLHHVGWDVVELHGYPALVANLGQ